MMLASVSPGAVGSYLFVVWRRLATRVEHRLSARPLRVTMLDEVNTIQYMVVRRPTWERTPYEP